MNCDQVTCRDAAFDVLLERELTERRATADVAEAAVRRPERPRRNPWHTLAAAAGLLVVATTAWLQSRPATLAQNPRSEPHEVVLESAEHLRRIADQVHDARAQFVQVVTMVFPLGGVRGQQVDFVEVPDARIAIADGRQLARDLAGVFARPRDRSASHQDALLDLHLPVTGGHYVHVRCHRTRGKVSVSSGGLGLRHVDGPLANSIREWMEAASERAGETFLFADGELRDAPATVTQLLGYGVDDDGLRATRRMAGLRRVKLVGRRTDEYPQDYEGVSLTADGLAHLATCATITHLHLESAALDDRALAIVAGFAELRELTLADGRRCTFTARGIGMLANLPRLRRVDIDRCDAFDDDCATALARSRTVEQVRLKECASIRGAGSGALCAMPNLTRLELVAVDVEGAAAAARSQTLRELKLSGCTGRFLDFSGLPKLSRLTLRKMSVDADAVASLQATPLRELTVTSCPTIAAHLTRVAAMPHLESLAIAGVRRGADWPAVFANLREARDLRRLSLLQNALTDDDVLHVRHLQQLERLDLRLNEVSERRADELRRWLDRAVVHVTVLPTPGK